MISKGGHYVNAATGSTCSAGRATSDDLPGHGVLESLDDADRCLERCVDLAKDLGGALLVGLVPVGLSADIFGEFLESSCCSFEQAGNLLILNGLGAR